MYCMDPATESSYWNLQGDIFPNRIYGLNGRLFRIVTNFVRDGVKTG